MREGQKMREREGKGAREREREKVREQQREGERERVRRGKGERERAPTRLAHHGLFLYSIDFSKSWRGGSLAVCSARA